MVNLWLLLIVMGFTLASLVSVVNVITYFDDSGRGLHLAISPALFYFPLAILFTVLVFHHIPYFASHLCSVCYLIFIKQFGEGETTGTVNEAALQNQVSAADLRKEELKARGPQAKPNFLVKLP